MSHQRVETKLAVILSSGGLAVGGLLIGLLIGTAWTKGSDPAWLESVSTLAAAVVAAIAAVSALYIAHRDRQNAVIQARTDRQHATRLSVITDLENRYRDLQDQLQSFDRYAGARYREIGAEEPREGWQAEVADYSGRLRGSSEELPQARQLIFSHFQPSEEELGSWLEGYVTDYGNVGDPEVEPLGAMVIRGELLTRRDYLLAEIARERAQLSRES